MENRLQNMYSAINSQEIEGLHISPQGEKILLMYATHQLSLEETTNMIIAMVVGDGEN